MRRKNKKKKEKERLESSRVNPDQDDRFFFIPWDYDHTFEGRRIWLSNHLFNRLGNERPGHDDRVRARWRELRAGPLAEVALAARIEEMAARLDGYMDWEYARLQRAVPPTYRDRVEEFRKAVLDRLRWMDDYLGYVPPDAAAGN